MNPPRPAIQLSPILKGGAFVLAISSATEASGGPAARALTVYETHLPDALRPLQPRTPSELRLGALVFERLVVPDPLAAEPLSPRLTAIVAEPGQITATVLADPPWHDGRPVTPHDICATVEAIVDPTADVTLPARDWLAGCTVAGDQVKIRFTRPFREPLWGLDFPILPQAAVETHLRAAGAVLPTLVAPRPPEKELVALRRDLPPELVGSGPMIAERRPQGWRFVPRAPGRSAVSRIDVLAGGPARAQVEVLVHGGVDAILMASEADRGRIEASGRRLVAWDPREVWSLSLNLADPVLEDHRVREALDLALDRQALAELAFGDADGALPASSAWPPAHPLAHRALEAAQGQRPRAEALLDEAGLRPQWERGLRAKGDQTVVLTLSVDPRIDADYPGFHEALLSAWSAVGLHVEPGPPARCDAPGSGGASIVLCARQPPGDADPAWWVSGGPFDRSTAEVSGWVRDSRGDDPDAARNAAWTLQGWSQEERAELWLFWPRPLAAFPDWVQPLIPSPGRFYEEIPSWGRQGARK